MKKVTNGTKELKTLIDLDYQARLDSPDFAEKLEDAINWQRCLLCQTFTKVSETTGACEECELFLDKKFEKLIKKNFAFEYEKVVRN